MNKIPEGYVPIVYRDIKKGLYYMNEDGHIINKFFKPVKINKYNRVCLQRYDSTSSSYIVLDIKKKLFRSK